MAWLSTAVGRTDVDHDRRHARTAEERGREVRFGVRPHTISRDSACEAWAAAERLLSDLDAETMAAARRALGRSVSVGQQRMLALHGGGSPERDRLEFAPDLWAGAGLVRGGAGTERPAPRRRSVPSRSSGGSAAPSVTSVTRGEVLPEREDP